MMDLKESSISGTLTGSSGTSCAPNANYEPNQRQNTFNSSTATPVISLFKLKNFLYQPKFKSLLSTDGKRDYVISILLFINCIKTLNQLESNAKNSMI
jgi:hypothetical protein